MREQFMKVYNSLLVAYVDFLPMLYLMQAALHAAGITNYDDEELDEFVAEIIEM